MTQRTEVVFLTSGNDLGRIAARRLTAAFPGVTIIVERPIEPIKLIRGRIRRLGILRVAGQLAFIGFSRLLAFGSRRRIATILRDADILEIARNEAAAFVAHPPADDDLPRAVGYLRDHWQRRYGLVLVG